MNNNELSLKKHYEWKGKIKIAANTQIDSMQDLAVAYTPGVAQPCLEIEKDISKSYDLTRRHNLVAVVTDGTAVLGLGDIGPEAAMPVMEGKCLLFKEFADIDAFPICVRSKNVDEIVRTVSLISGSFGGINLEDISSPRCFEIERRLKEVCDIPVFHDDQHGTAVIANAALHNALKIVGKKIDEIKIIINGAGAAGIAIGKLIMKAGAKKVIFLDRKGVITKHNSEKGSEKHNVALMGNTEDESGTLSDVIKGADVFIGVSQAGILSGEMVKSMAKDPIIFAMANPVPEIMPDEAKAAGAAIVGTGRSDFPNQINNVLAFPGIFRGALDCRAKDITDSMKLAASKALAEVISDDELTPDYIIPSPFDQRVAGEIAKAVIEAAKKEDLARI